MELSKLKQDLKNEAAKLEKPYEKYDITFLADNYVKAVEEQDTSLQSIYISALLLRYWYVINKTYQKVKTCGYDYLDCFHKLFDCINVACEYKAWQTNKAYNADQCIKQVIGSRGSTAMIIKANLQKNNNRAVISTDATIDNQDNDRTFEETRNFGSYTWEPDLKNFEKIKYSLNKNHDITSAILIDLITNSDCLTAEKKFSTQKLAAIISKLDNNYVRYFSKAYDIDTKKISRALENITKIKSRTSFNEFLNHYFYIIKKNFY